jgi:RNA polymerase sigma-70 factor (ECF subfamily)
VHPKRPLARLSEQEVTGPAETHTSVHTRDDEEQAIIDECRRGTPLRYRVLVERYRRAVNGITHRLTGSASDAEELAQQSFVDAYAALDGFRDGARFSSWLYRIAVNNCKDHLKSRKRSEVALDGEVESERGRFSASFVDPESALAARERRGRIIHALQRLPLKYRTMLVLRDLEDLPYEKIGAIVRRPLTTLKIRVVRARKMLRDLLEAEGVT